MAFSTQRGRPRKPLCDTDLGTPELRLKHAMRFTSEPIDACLEKRLITTEQHWCGLHLRWLYTLRYGAPSLTTRYTDRASPGSALTPQDPHWREMREREYTEAATLLKQHRRYEPVVRLAIFNETPSFLSPLLSNQALKKQALALSLAQAHADLRDGLELLAHHWKRKPSPLL